jgi:uncharacterized SAM-binding protein YcdF (DUF218 family)
MQRGLLAVAALVLLGLGIVPLAAGHFHLGVLVPVGLGLAGGYLAWRWAEVQTWCAVAPWRRWLWRAAWLGLLLWVISVGWLWQRIAGLGQTPASVPRVAAIVVLGSGTEDGKPRPALAMRLDTAAQLAALQPQAALAVSGGVDFGQDESEGAIMARYLAETYGLDPRTMVVEERSTSTVLNLEWTGPMLQARGVDLAQPIAIVSSDFHLWRALHIAKSQGFGQPIGVAAPTPLLTRFNVWLREYFAVASSWALAEW